MKRISITIRAFVVLLLVPLHASISQEIASLRAGEPIRLSVASPVNSRVEGRLVSVSSDAIQLSGANNQLPISFSNIRLLEVKRRTGGSFIRSVAFGLLGGVVSGAVLGLASGSIDTGDGIITAPDMALIGSILGGTAGIIGGTLFGVCCSSSWRPLAYPPGR